MNADDWTIADTKTAAAILDYLGIGSEASKEPVVDRRRDDIAKIIRARVDYEVAQEREGCAFAVECHRELVDPATADSCASLIRERSDAADDCVHVPREIYERLISRPHGQHLVADPTPGAKAPSAVDALQAIADLPTPLNLKIMAGHEDAYRAVELLFVTPPRIVATQTR